MQSAVHNVCTADSLNPDSIDRDRYTGTDGIYTHTVAYERDPACLECSPAAPLEVQPDATLQQVRDSTRLQRCRLAQVRLGKTWQP